MIVKRLTPILNVSNPTGEILGDRPYSALKLTLFVAAILFLPDFGDNVE